MPTYEYNCKNCKEFSINHSMNESIFECPSCGLEVDRIYSVSGISFKGPGFYSTDSKSK